MSTTDFRFSQARDDWDQVIPGQVRIEPVSDRARQHFGFGPEVHSVHYFFSRAVLKADALREAGYKVEAPDWSTIV